MKKSLMLFTVGLSFALVACGSQSATETAAEAAVEPVAEVIEEEVEGIIETSVSVEDTDDIVRHTVERKEETEVAKEVSVSDYSEAVTVLADYSYSDMFGWYSYHFYIIRNDSDETLNISVSSMAYDVDGNPVSVDNSSVEAVGSGCVTIIYNAFDTDVNIASYESTWSAKPDKTYRSVIQNLDYKINDINNGVIVQVTNNGDITAQFVKGYALFFNGNELVDYDWTYFTDDNSEISPGATISKQLSCYDDFDAVEFYMMGRHSGRSD